MMRIVLCRLASVAILVAAASMSATEEATVWLPMMIGIENESSYRWSFSIERSAESPSGWLLPRTCNEAASQLRGLIPADLAEILLKAKRRIARKHGRGRAWSQEELFEFHALAAKLIDDRYPGHGGYWWEFKDWLLHAWLLDGDRQRPDWSKILCDPKRLVSSKSPSARFDALVEIPVQEQPAFRTM